MAHGLVFAKYAALAASTRQRIIQTMPYLMQKGITIDIQPFFDNAYLETLFKYGKRNSLKVLDAYRARFLTLLSCKKYDFLWVQYELFPYLPSPMETLIRFANKPIIYDFDDAIFHQYDQHSNPLVRNILSNKLVPLLKIADGAFCGNSYLEEYAKRYCKHTEIIPTTVDRDLYFPGAEINSLQKPVLGWIGSPSTWNYCLPFANIFSSYVKTNQLSVVVIGAGKTANKNSGFEFREWAEQREVQDIAQMDIGIMPIPDEPWARGKCGYKLIQYMACGLPVIASPVGVNREIVEHGVNGFLASTESEWRDAIERLVEDAQLRQRMGQAGRAKVEKQYSIQTVGPRIAALIQELLSQD